MNPPLISYVTLLLWIDSKSYAAPTPMDRSKIARGSCVTLPSDPAPVNQNKNPDKFTAALLPASAPASRNKIQRSSSTALPFVPYITLPLTPASVDHNENLGKSIAALLPVRSCVAPVPPYFPPLWTITGSFTIPVLPYWLPLFTKLRQKISSPPPY